MTEPGFRTAIYPKNFPGMSGAGINEERGISFVKDVADFAVELGKNPVCVDFRRSCAGDLFLFILFLVKIGRRKEIFP